MTTETVGSAVGQHLAIKFTNADGSEVLLVAAVAESYPTKANAAGVDATVMATIESLEALLATAKPMPVAPMSSSGMQSDGQIITASAQIISASGQIIDQA